MKLIYCRHEFLQVFLDKILDFQISPLDKTSLGYKKDKEKSEDDTWFPKTPEAGASTSKTAPHAPTHDNKDPSSSRMHQGEIYSSRKVQKRNSSKMEPNSHV